MTEVKTLHQPFAKFVRDSLPHVRLIRARSDQRSTIAKGWPDFTLIAKGIGPLLIEFKGDKTPVSTDQKKCHADLASIGLPVHVIRDLEIAITLTREWANGAPSKAVVTSEAEKGSGVAPEVVTRLWMGKLTSFRVEPDGSLTRLNTKV